MDEPSVGAAPWLDDEQQRAWLAVIRMVMRLPAALEADLLHQTGLTMFEYLVLSQLSEAPDRILRMSGLAGRANSSLSRLSHVVGRLEKRGWVLRRPCQDDGRVTEAVLTDEGWTKLSRSAPLHVAAVRELVVDAMSPTQLTHLAAAATLVSRAIDAGGPGSPSVEGCPADPSAVVPGCPSGGRPGTRTPPPAKIS